MPKRYAGRPAFMDQLASWQRAALRRSEGRDAALMREFAADPLEGRLLRTRNQHWARAFHNIRAVDLAEVMEGEK